MTYFWNFGTPSISQERLELETSNLACRFTTRGANERNAKLGQRWPERGHVTYFWNFGTPSISRKRLELHTSNYKNGYRRRSCTSETAKIHSSVRFVMYCIITTCSVEYATGSVVMEQSSNMRRRLHHIQHADSSPGLLTKEMQN